jgi:FtsZ-binding cell division protein ZapB
MNSTGSSIREPKVNENIDKIDIYQLTISEYTEKLKLYFPIQDSDGKNKNVVETILEANK